MTINIYDLKKKLTYRSNYRGTKEMDSLLGDFTKKYINLFNHEQLMELDELLNLDDESLFKINQGHKMQANFKKNSVINLFKKYKYKK
jgi:antitoxin CptB